MRTIKLYDGMVVKVKDDKKTKDMVWDMLMTWFTDHEAFSCEVLCQNDECNIDAPNLLGDIVDKIFICEECD